MDCLVEDENITRSNYMSYQLDICFSNAGNFALFFFVEETDEILVDTVLRLNPGLKNNREVRYTSGRIYHKSMFGVDRNSIYSREVALYQLLRMDTKLNKRENRLLQRENIFMDYLKERMLWALLGVVSGDTSIESVEVQTAVELATLNAFFVTGIVGILVAVLLLLIFGTYSGPRNAFMPVDSEAMLQSLRPSDCCAIYEKGDWPELCITRVSDDDTGLLSFSGGEPMSCEHFSTVFTRVSDNAT